MAGDIRVQRDDDTISVEATGFELSRAGAAWRPTSLEARLTRKDGRIATIAARADYLRIENLAVFAALLPAGATRDRLQTLAPRGEVFGLDVTVVDQGVKRLPDITGRLRFTDIGFGPVGNAAGITGFDGSVEGRGAGGIVNLATRDATIDWPQQWRAPAAVLKGDGRIEWQRFGDGVRLWLDDAVADSGHGVARGKLRMLLRPGEAPLMDVDATATNFDVTQLWRYLQIRRLSPKAIRWLDAAFRQGRVTEAKVSITGPTRGFPYREGQGLFRASGHATGVNLNFAANWPELRGVEAISISTARRCMRSRARAASAASHSRRPRSTPRIFATPSMRRAARPRPMRVARFACCRRRRWRRHSARCSRISPARDP